MTSLIITQFNDDPKTIARAERSLRLLANGIRFRIVAELVNNRGSAAGHTAAEIARALGGKTSLSLVLHQLKPLRRAGIVERRKVAGRWTYSFNDVLSGVRISTSL